MMKYVFSGNTLFFIWTFLGFALGVSPRSRRLPVNNDPFNVDAIKEWQNEPWISDNIKFGQISGVSIDPDENVYIFHRADRVWDQNSFINNEYNRKDLGPISQATILVFKNDGSLVNQLGKDMFYLPHGITVDREFNIWVTDVALHQVMKLSSNGTSLVLGEKFVPGNGLNHFCKPTSVAVVSNGDFFVADGYCNSRIMKYNAEGKKILEWGRDTSRVLPPGHYDLNIPHALALAEDIGAVCTADRENGRVVCYRIDNGNYITELTSNVMGQQIFSVAYSSNSGGQFSMINGPRAGVNVPVQGVVLNPSGNIIGKFGRNLTFPHDVAITSDGNTIYVVEIAPYKAWKFVKRDCDSASHHMSEETLHPNLYTRNVDSVEGLTGAVLVTIGCFVFAVGLFMAVIIYSKARKSPSSDTRRLLSNIDY